MMDIHLEGLEGVMDMLARLDGDELIQAARTGLQAGLQKIRGEARMLCPKDTGELANSIKTRTKLEADALVGEVYASSDHAVYVEMGTGPKGEASHAGIDPEMAAKVTYSPKGWTYRTKGGEFRYTNGMPARPFLYPAFKANQNEVKKKIVSAIIRRGGA